MVTKGPASRMVGRDTELTLLGESLAEVRAGRGRAVLIEGEAGIGKSGLLAAALAGADKHGCQVIQGVCDELTRRFPLSVVTQALGLSEFLGDERRAQVAAVLARPEPAAGPGIGMMPGDPVLAAVEELLELIHRLSADRPLVLALEDLHWADMASLLFWQRLCRVTPQMPLLLIGTRRPVPPRERAGLLAREVQACGGAVVSLGGLTPAGVEAMAEGLVHGTPGPRLSHWLERAAGNPFYVRELLDAAARSGALRATGGVAELAEEASANGGLERETASLQHAIAGRLNFLSTDTLRVLRTAALLGPEFSVTDLAAVAERTPATLLPVVEDAMAAGLLESAGPRLRFRHPLLQQALDEAMPAPIRAGLHRQAARTLIAMGSSAERIAQQLLAVADVGEDWEVGWLAANAAILASRVPAVAVNLLEQVLRHVLPSDPRRVNLEDHLADALFVLGRYEEVEQITRVILPHATDPDRYGRLAWLLGYALLQAYRYEDAVVALEAAADRPDVSPVWRARFDALRAMVLRYTGPGAEAIEAAALALAAGRRLADATAIAYALHAQSIQHFDNRDLAGAAGLIDQALLVISGNPQLTDLRLLMLYNRVGFATELGHFEEAWDLARESLARSELPGSPRLGTLRMNFGVLAYELGRWDEATAELDAVTDVERDYQEGLHSIKALIAGHRDDWPEASRHLETLKSIVDGYAQAASPRLSTEVSVVMAAALGCERAGETRQAVTLLAEWLEPGREHLWYKVLPMLVRLALAVHDEPMAQVAAKAAVREADREPLVRKQATAQWCEGLVRRDPAVVRAAGGSLRDLGLLLDAGNALEDAAVLLAQGGDTASARDVLDEALRLYAQLGAAWDARRAGARVRPFGVRPGVRGLRRRPRTGWQALTSMELQVAELLVAGHSNPDIAAQLFISRRTVESHVSHILAKLQVASRWEVKAVAE
jgi:DNA-binding CsgD family transcriptional regulator